MDISEVILVHEAIQIAEESTTNESVKGSGNWHANNPPTHEFLNRAVVRHLAEFFGGDQSWNRWIRGHFCLFLYQSHYMTDDIGDKRPLPFVNIDYLFGPAT